MINRTIKGYEIKQLIATGGMAAIYRAIYVETGQTVAIKILHGHLAQDKDFIARFEREARAAAELRHENIINIYNYGEAEGVYYIAMEFVEGKSLKDLISSVKFMPTDLALAIIYEICRGVEHAHQKGVVHRDIKPANILITHNGLVKITDFGLAQAQDLTSITVTGAIVGTPAYMSPEQAAGKRIDTRSDLFSLGVVAYEMLTGTKPFFGETYSSVIHAILTIPAPSPVQANPLINEEIGQIVDKMLHKEVDKRYQNINQISDDIYAYFKKRDTEVPYRNIGEFVTEPERVAQDWMQKSKEKHLKLALHYITTGRSSTDDAISEFTKVRYLDPEDPQVKKYLPELRKKRRAQKPQRKKPVPIGSRRSLIQLAAVIGAILIITTFVAALYRNYQNNRSGSSTMGYLLVNSRPSDANVFLDDTDQAGRTPLKIDSVAIGAHTIHISKPGYLAYTNSINVNAGDTVTVDALLIREASDINTGSIAISSHPSDAQVLIDGVDTGLKTPCTVDHIKTGNHTIRIVKDGYQTAQVTRNIQSGQTARITADLARTSTRTSSQDQRKAYFRLNVDPWAKIYIDGRYVETTPIAEALQVSAGSHLVKLENPSFQTWQKRINFKPGETVVMDIKLEQFSGFLRISVRPWADVYIDGKFRETTPIADPIKLSAGTHTIKLINPSFQTHEEVISVVANQTIKKSVELIPK
jgi:serine/threonine protein kinase/archaellum component FlaG (FlaF/FlaG flagellin family)